MEDISSCSSGRERLGLRFTIDYLLYNKGAKSASQEAKIPTSEQAPDSTQEEQSPYPHSERGEERDSGGLGKGTEGSEEENEEPEGMKEEEEQEEPTITRTTPQDKPTQSYIALISMAILASEKKKLLLCDIYQWIMDHYPYFKSKDKNWRNSVRHNLSLNECFVKAGRSDNGKGHFWAIHPANYHDFSNGDYHRRQARRRIRRMTGQLPYTLSSPYYPLHLLRPRGTPCWCCPPTHPQPQPMSCLSARFSWSWAGLQARRHPALDTSAQ